MLNFHNFLLRRKALETYTIKFLINLSWENLANGVFEMFNLSAILVCNIFHNTWPNDIGPRLSFY